MLVMRQRIGQTILIGDVEVEILDISANRVKLGISGPKHVLVQRKEAELTRQENLAAAQPDLSALQGWTLPAN